MKYKALAVLAMFSAFPFIASAQTAMPTQGSWCYTFSGNLSVGMSGAAITALQTALAKDGESVAATGSFDAQTVAAVVAFQEKYATSILVPNGLTVGTGYVGNSTLAELNSLYGCENTSSIPNPISPPPIPCESNASGTPCLSTTTSVTPVAGITPPVIPSLTAAVGPSLTNTAIQALINQLVAQVSVLEQELAKLTSGSLTNYAGSVQTYTDPNGAFSFEYPLSFTANTTNNPDNNYLYEGLVEVDAPSSATSSGFALSSANASLSDFVFSYSPAGSEINQSTCENPGSGTPSGQSPEVSINGTDWFEGSQGSAAAGTDYGVDEYQTYRNGACWGVEFDWVSHPGEPSVNDAIVSAFEESVLGTVKFLNDNVAPYRESSQTGK